MWKVTAFLALLYALAGGLPEDFFLLFAASEALPAIAEIGIRASAISNIPLKIATNGSRAPRPIERFFLFLTSFFP